jgi:hypothetical protein
MGIEQEGSIAFRMRHPDADWATNDKPYQFNPVDIGPVRAWAAKRPDGTVEFRLIGPLKSEIVLEGKMPPVNEHGLHVVITWSQKEVQVYLNARPHGVVLIPPAKTGGPADA